MGVHAPADRGFWERAADEKVMFCVGGERPLTDSGLWS